MIRALRFPLVLLALAACGDEQPAGGGGASTGGGLGVAAPPTGPQGPGIPAADPNDPLTGEMQRRAAQFAQGMEPATPLFRGSLATGQNQDYQAVLQSDRCFKVIGVGAPTVTDLDLFLFDPQGTQIQQDTASDAYPVLGLRHAICPDLAGSYRVQVRMFAGSGEYGVQVFFRSAI